MAVDIHIYIYYTKIILIKFIFF